MTIGVTPRVFTGSMKLKRLEVALEFFIFGVILGVVEDAIAVKIVTGEPITWKMIGIIVLVTIPFAIIGEIVVDNLSILKGIKKVSGKKYIAGRSIDEEIDKQNKKH
jgi:hypothetical protein